ncbi:MAG: ABC transporter ATP-binding protein [Clostridiales Family XIII bacterium]|jgi:ABC-2 type transport system ATP-binding protein|nr:ABC transporter ATP-binding protein [Clostridiales Family XIII bacterium]
MISLENVSLRYRRTVALDDVSLTIGDGVICGVLGRNGSGKTSLLSLIAAWRRPSGGSVRVLGENPYENPRVMSQVAMVLDRSEAENPLSVKETLKMAALFRPNWDAAYADRLLRLFELPAKKSVASLSKGKAAALRCVVGLAARTPVTIYDEAYLGLDAAYRKLFITELLEDFTNNPRTVLLSTHFIGEMENIFSEALILDGGRLMAHEDCDALRARGTTVAGMSDAVQAFVDGKNVLSRRAIGNQSEAILFGALDPKDRAEAARLGLSLGGAPLQELVIAMTGKEE